MAHTTNDQTPPDLGESRDPAGSGSREEQLAEGLNLPAVRPVGEAAAEVSRSVPLFGRDLVRTIGRASRAVSYLDAVPSDSYDVTVSALTVLECLGISPADAVQAAADAVRQAPELEIHGLLWARVGGPDVWDYRVTVLVSSDDSDLDEGDEPTHLADRRTCRVVLYVDALDEATVPREALTALDRSGLTQADALQATADALRQAPGLAVEALLWARVPALRPGRWEYRITVLTASAAAGGADQPDYFEQGVQ